MNTLKIKFLELAITALTSKETLETIKIFVWSQFDKSKSGEEKRREVLERAKATFAKYSTTVLNILIEIAVLSIKGKINEK